MLCVAIQRLENATIKHNQAKTYHYNKLVLFCVIQRKELSRLPITPLICETAVEGFGNVGNFEHFIKGEVGGRE